MHVALFILYGILCGYGILKLPVFRRSGIKRGPLLALFALHVAVGCMHAVIAWRYFPDHGDLWDGFQWSLRLRNWLHTDFHQFLLFNSKWTYFTHNGIIFIDLLLNFLSADNLYVNTLLFSFAVFLGNISLYRVFRRHFPNDPLVAALVFLLPSTLFWTACLFREGVLYMLLGFFFDQLDRSRIPKTSAANRRTGIVITGCCFLLILYFRFYVGLFLIPALLIQYWIDGSARRLLAKLAGAAVLLSVAVILVEPGVPGFFLRGLGHWQMQFQVLEGHSRLYLPAIDGSWSGLFRTLPYAFLNGFLEPLPGSGGRPIYLVFSVELILIWIIVAIALLAPRARASTGSATDGFPAACLVFAILGLLAVGIMVPFAGAIVRYRSIYLPFLLAPALHALRALPPFRRLNQWLSNKL